MNVLGIMVDQPYRKGLAKNRRSSALLMLEAAQELGMELFFFTEDGIDRDKEWIGLKRRSDRWVETEEFPDIIYNRAFSASRRTNKYLASLTALQQINERIGYWKWDVHQVLELSSPKEPWFLETYRYQSLEQLNDLCNRHPIVFVKPSRGLKSIGVVRLEKVGGHIYYEYRGKGNEKYCYKRGNVLSINDLPTEVKLWFVRKEHVIQKGVDLAMINGRRFDFRVLAQKNERGKWRLYPKAKVSSFNHAITVFGLWGDVQTLLNRVFPQQNILKDLLNTSWAVLDLLDRNFARAGEIGLDLAVDRYGRVYFLEANSMPGKGMYAGAEYEEIVTNPIRYAKFLYTH